MVGFLHRRRLVCTVWTLLIGLALASCGSSTSSSPTSPSSAANISGTWRGEASSSAVPGTVRIAATFTQSGASVSGTYVCSAGTLSCLHASGTVSGTMSGNSLTAQVAFADGHSCGAFNGTMSGNTLSGSYSCADPVGNDSGIWTMTTQ